LLLLLLWLWLRGRRLLLAVGGSSRSSFVLAFDVVPVPTSWIHALLIDVFMERHAGHRMADAMLSFIVVAVRGATAVTVPRFVAHASCVGRQGGFEPHQFVVDDADARLGQWRDIHHAVDALVLLHTAVNGTTAVAAAR
jgi:hypothetical protein